MLKTIARLLPPAVKERLRNLLSPTSTNVSQNYRDLTEGAYDRQLQSWQNAKLANTQAQAFQKVINELKSGVTRADFMALKAAFDFIQAQNELNGALILEVGCASCWNKSALEIMGVSGFDYLGLDISLPMLELTRKENPHLQVVVGDAQKLPFLNQSVDILLSGTSLMHIPDWKLAIAESRRIARKYCIFHTVPIVINASTKSFEKDAYGETVWEWCFNETELIQVFAANNLEVCGRFLSLEYNLQSIMGESTTTVTFVCRVEQTQ